jgi:hypothetical protein
VKSFSEPWTLEMGWKIWASVPCFRVSTKIWYVPIAPIATILKILTSTALSQILQVVKQSKRRLFAVGNEVIAAGSFADSVFVVCSGILSCRISGKEVRQLHAGHSFGEMAIYFDIVRGLFKEHTSILGDSVRLERYLHLFTFKLIFVTLLIISG